MSAQPVYPRVSIAFCTQCKWLLRAAWYAQELMSTFSTDIGEVALQPSTGGTFIVTLSTGPNEDHLVWDRKAEGGFPDSKDLKKRIRNVIQPERDLGHVDKHGSAEGLGAAKEKKEPKEKIEPTDGAVQEGAKTGGPAEKEEICLDCQ